MRTPFRIWTVIVLLAGCLSARAQDEYASGFGLDPSDAAALKEINARMDKIRKHRPAVALVLSGGGAKGGAHIGAIRYLEEQGIPVDMVLGTSVGGLIGGFVALGYNAAQLDSMVRSIDWDLALSDRVDHGYIPYSRTKYKEKYAVSIPFYYDRENYILQRTGEESLYADRRGELDLSAEEDATSFIRRNLSSSLPSGLVFGQNVNSIFSSISVGYQDSLDFFDLPVPFACVATDLVSGRAKVWHSGNLTTALRSTMSIPGLFTPVRVNGMVLVDGGMRNNFPTDLAVKMGADIVIGVDLSGEDGVGYNDVNNLGDVFGQSVDMLSKDSFRRNTQITDVTIKPDITGYGMLSFNDEAIDTLIARGYRAAQEKATDLAIVKYWVDGGKTEFQNAPAVDVGVQPVEIRDILIEGLHAGEAEYVLGLLSIGSWMKVDRHIIEEEVARIYGTGMFDYVTWGLLGREEPYRLRLDCRKGPVNQLGVGFRIDSEEVASILLNVGFGTNSIRGNAVAFNAKLGINPALGLHWHRNRARKSTVNGDVSFRWVTRNNLHYYDDTFNLTYFQTAQQIYLSNINWSTYDVNIGLRNDVFAIRELFTGGESSFTVEDTRPHDYLSAFVKMRAETLDDGYFPSKGYSIGLRYDLSYSFGPAYDGGHFFHTMRFDAKFVTPIGGWFALIPSMDLRMLVGSKVPVPFANVLGGSLAGRYVEQQMPFIGINKAEICQNNLLVLRNDFRFKLAKSTFLSGIFNYGADVEDLAQFQLRHLFGAGLELGYDSVAGPLKFDAHWSNVTGFGVYVSLGFDF